MFKQMSDLASLLRSAGELRRKMDNIAVELRCKRVTGSAGAGMVEVDANGLGEVLAVRIDPTLMAGGDREMIEDLLPGAINQAASKAKELHLEMAQSASEGLSLPGMEEILSKMMPK